MRNQQFRYRINRSSFVRRGLTLFMIMAFTGLATFTGLNFVKQAHAAPQTAADYCNQYTTNTLKNACKDGLNDADCTDYAITFDQATADICEKASKDKASGLVTPGSVTVSPSPTPTPSSDPNSDTPKSNFDIKQFQDILSQTNSLSQYLDVLHAAGPDSDVDITAEADNNYGSYVNGAGKQQRIDVVPSGQPNSPAIVFFNGGGWHADDGTSHCVTIGSPQKNCGADGGGAGDKGAPAGGGATQRGYTTFNVTYRLGSSGVYYMYEDVMRGLQHVRSNADMYGIDPSKIAVWGDSAGGSLAMRVGASGKSGAKAAVGWSAPTNAYTGLFKSFSSMLIGMDHSTCVPTDLAGMANFTDLANGGSGNVAEYGQGLSSNDFSGLGITSGQSGVQFDKGGIGLGTLTEILTAGQYAMQTSQNIESISKQLESGGIQGMSGSLVNLTSKKLIECIDNFNVLSPALFASPESAPSFLAGFETDTLIDPQQAYDMRDKLHTLGIRAEALILPGDADAATPAIGASENHLGYDPRFVCRTINFLDEIIQPEKGQVNCETGVADNQGSNCTASAPTIKTASRTTNARLAAVVMPDPNPTYSDVKAGQVKTPTNSSGGPSQGGIGTGAGRGIGNNNNVNAIPKSSTPNGTVGQGGGTIGNGNGGGVSGSTNQPTSSGVPPQGENGSGNGSSGGGSGGGGAGGGSCAPAVPAGAPAAPGGGGGASDLLGGLGGAGGGLGSLGSLLGGFGGFGGLGNSAPNSNSGNTNTGNTGSNTSNTGQGTGTNNDGGGFTKFGPGPAVSATGIGEANDFTGKRGGTSQFVESKRSGNCTVDYSRAPGSRAGGNTIVDICNKELGYIEQITGPLVHLPPVQIMFIPNSYPDDGISSGVKMCKSKEEGGRGAIAFALAGTGRLYVCSQVWNPSDLGVIVHEVAHLTQGYIGAAPSWVVEGIADYVRRELGYNNPNEKYSTGNTFGCGSTSTYTSGYKCTDALFVFIKRKYNKPDLVKTIHTGASKGAYTDSLITAGTNKTVDQLYRECLQAECKGGKAL